MIITCPKCTRRYQIDDTLLEAEGQLQRKLKCHVCTHTWVYFSPHIRNLSHLTTEDNPYPPQAAIANMESASNVSSRVGWFLYFLTLSLLFLGLFFGKNTFIHLWPPISQFYNILGSYTVYQN